MGKLEGKVAVITGGNSGIGLATAKEFKREGAAVVIAGRDQNTLNEAVEALGNESLGVKTDVSSLKDLENLFQAASQRFGKIDVLFVNAGVAKFAPLTETDEALFDEIVNINFKGSYFTVKYALPHLNDGASIIFTTTVAAKRGMATASAYAGSKAALHALTRIFAAELLGRGIRVNAVSPGPIETPIFGRMGVPEEAKKEMKDGLATQVPMKRLGTSEEVAKAVAFLASDDSSFITGVEIDVDGGTAQL